MKSNARKTATGRAILAILATILYVGKALAGANYWKGSSGNWNDESNWQNAFNDANNVTDHNAYLPVVGVTITFTDAFKYGNYGVYYQIIVDNGLESPIVWTADSDEHGFTSDSTSGYMRLAVGSKPGKGSLEIQKGTYVFGSYVGIADNDSGANDGALTVSGGTLVSTNFYIGGAAGYTGTMTVSGGDVTSLSTMNIGSGSSSAAATGTVSVASGSITTPTLRVGNGTNSKGAMAVSGGSVTMSSNFYIADGASEGSVSVSDGTLTAQSGLYVGQGGSGSGELDISGGTVNVTGGDFIVANNKAVSNAYVSVSGGELVIANSWKHGVGTDKTATGAAKVADGNISGGTVTIGSELSVGHGEYTQSRLTLDGGTVTAKTITIGNNEGASGWLTNNNATASATTLNVANGKNTSGELYIAGGEFTAGNVVNAYNAGATANITVAGGEFNVTNSSDGVKIGHSAGSSTTIRVDGGEMNVASRIYHFGSGTTGTVEVASGVLNVTGNFDMGTTYADGGIGRTVLSVTGGEANFGAISLGGGTSGTQTYAVESVVTLSGGTTTVNQVTTYGSYTSVTDTFTFNGGTLKASSSPSSPFIKADDRLTVTVGTNGGTIDSNGSDITVAQSIGGTGTLTKTGSGTLTFSANPTCPVRIEEGNVVFADGTMSGKVTVASGAMVTYDDDVTYSGGIEIEEGGCIVWDKTGYTSGMTYTLPTVTLPDDADITHYVIILAGARATIEFSDNNTKVTITDNTDYETGITTTWIGGHGNRTGEQIYIGGVALTQTDGTTAIKDMHSSSTVGDAWVNPANWTLGVPCSVDTAEFIADAEVSCQDSVGYYCSGYEVAKLSIKDGASVKIFSAYESNNYYVPTLRPHEVDSDSEGTLTLVRCNVLTADDCSIAFPEKLTIVSMTTQDSDNSKRAAIKGKSGATITVNGEFSCPSGFAEINSDSGTKTAAYTTINGPITGEGWIYVSGWPLFAGDNSDFAGTIYADGNFRISNTASTSSNAYWRIRGDFHVDVSTGGTLRFGTLYMDNNAKCITLASTDSALVFEVGAGYMSGKKYIDISSSCDVTLKKVTYSDDDAGTFIYEGYGFPKVVVDAGEFVFQEYSGDGGYTKSDKYKYIDTMTVASDAILSGTNHSSHVAITSLTLEESASIRGPGTQLTSVTTADVDGAKIIYDGDDLDGTTSYALITATSSVSGTASASNITGYVAATGDTTLVLEPAVSCTVDESTTAYISQSWVKTLNDSDSTELPDGFATTASVSMGSGTVTPLVAYVLGASASEVSASSVSFEVESVEDDGTVTLALPMPRTDSGATVTYTLKTKSSPDDENPTTTTLSGNAASIDMTEVEGVKYYTLSAEVSW